MNRGLACLLFVLLNTGVCVARADTDVALITGSEPGGSYVERLRHARELPETLAEAPARELLRYLTQPEEADGNTLDGAATAAIRNQIAEFFLDIQPRPEELATALLDGQLREEHSGLWRDYQLQFMGRLIPKAGPDTRARLLERLWAATDSREDINAGTALLALNNHTAAHVDSTRLGDKAIRIARDATFPAGARLSALHVATDQKHPEALALARTWLSPSQAFPLRLCAINTLAVLGSPADAPLLEPLRQSAHPSLRNAATAALTQFQSKNPVLLP